MYILCIIVSVFLAILVVILCKNSFKEMLNAYIKEFSENKNQVLDERKYKRKLEKVIKNDEFEKMYDQLYQEHNQILEEKRKKYRNSFVIATIISIGIFMGFIGIVISLGFVNAIMYEEQVKCSITVSTFVFIFFIFLFIKNKKVFKYAQEYKYYYKSNIVGNVIANIFGISYYNYGQLKENVKYDFNNAEKIYAEAKFNNESVNATNLKNYIVTGLNSNSRIVIADIEDISKAFRGVFSFSRTEKNIPHKLYIVKNKTGFFYQEPKVDLDSHGFERYFDVYCHDKILAMQILTSDVIQLIQDFYDKFNLQFEIMFENDRMYMRFTTGKVLEPRILRKSIEKEEIFIYYSILCFIRDFNKAIRASLNKLEI